MRKAVSAIRKSILYISTLVLVASYPAAAMATTQEPVTEPAPAVTSAPAEVTTPEEEKPLTYTYDEETKKWNSEAWQYDPETGTYVQPPAPTIIEPVPVVTDTAEQTAEKTIETSVNIDNKVISDAISGDALISKNTEAGSALSGDATAAATIINSVNSSISAGENQKIATFTKDIVGDVEGDIILYPMLLKAMLEAKASEVPTTTINSTTDLNVNNDITLNANSGSATVDSNTTAGDATTGNAAAMANVVNILNSLISTQESFIGTINIYGSLEGDILIAPDFIPQMIANNGGSDGTSTQLSKQDTTTIVNNISAVAESGAAEVFSNTKAGSATTGDADTGVVIFNVTGHDIVAENSMLVFVNVLGRWVGMIIDAPEGATAAMIGSGVSNSEKYAPDVVVDSQSRHGITNTIAVNAASGDAVVSNNTNAGNATSGNASAFANVANVSNSSLSLAGWFGLLFINITGDWFGSFQIDTPYGNTPKEAEKPQPKPTGPVQFVPGEDRPPKNVPASVVRTVVDSRFIGSPVASASSTETEVLAETKSEVSKPEVKSAVTEEPSTKSNPATESNPLFMIVVGSVVLVGASAAGVRRFV